MVSDSLLSIGFVREHLANVEPLDNDLRHVLRWLEDNRGLWFRGDVLVVGCLEEPISNALAISGANVVGVDVREYGHGDFPSGLDKPAYEHVVSDFTQWVSDRKFDLIVSVSAIEHFGLGYYKDNLDERGDFKAVRKMGDMLKPGGKIVLTFPFSNQPQVTRHWRSYDPGMIKDLVGGLKEKSRKYFFTGYTGQHNATEEDVRCYKGGADLSVMLVLVGVNE